ncbi:MULTISPECIES: DUF4037 domain-containing protein [Agrobacterium]|uniref:DUF4037 domain-containing protein n=1 Tax=Agrobacterium TaxID=357 RepID=UPI003BA2E7C2
MQEHFSELPYAACRIGLGSEVLGYDTEISADHDYGPCVQVLLSEADFAATADQLMSILDRRLPAKFEEWAVWYPTNVRPPKVDAREPGMLGSDHGVELYTLHAWCERFLGRQFSEDLSARDWLSYSEQLFLMVTAGAVFRDDLGELRALRSRLAYFPRDVWLYKLAAQWGRIAEERAYVGRTGEAGDEIGSRIIAARMVGNIMRLAMLIERQYAPYAKWFGTAFSRLECASELKPILLEILSAESWQTRESGLMRACQLAAELQIAKEVPGAIAPVLGTLHKRPFRFVDSLKIFDGLRAAIKDSQLQQLQEFGGADQFLSSNFVLAVPAFSEAATGALWDST